MVLIVRILLFRVPYYALATRTQPDEVLGSQSDYKQLYLSQVQIHSTTQVEATQYPNSDSPTWVPSLSRNARTLRIS